MNLMTFRNRDSPGESYATSTKSRYVTYRALFATIQAGSSYTTSQIRKNNKNSAREQKLTQEHLMVVKIGKKIDTSVCDSAEVAQ
jgi:hypothetical protein